MARARNIKPGFFRNADLVELSVEARLLFIGLWTIADREGRLEDRPKQIKMEIYPADSFDINSLLSELASTDMLLRYEVGGKRYLQIVNFTRHQNPHKDERQSTIPPPDGLSDPSGPADHDEHHASTVQTPCEHHASTVQTGLIPDSLIPDSRILNPESTPAQPASTEVDARPEKPAAGAAVRFDPIRYLLEHGADQQTAEDYIAQRKGKNAASSHTALRAIVSEAEKARLPLQAALELCCARGWVGFKAEWADQQARAGPPAANSGKQARINNYWQQADKERRNEEVGCSTERDITGESVRIA